jgi:hypothetical protein
MGVFDNMHESDPSGSGKWFAEGGYICRVRRCQFKVSQQSKGNMVLLEVTILEVPVHYDEHESWVQPGKMLAGSNKPGEVCFTALLLDRQPPAMGNLKGFLMGATRLSEDQIIQTYAEQHDPPLDVANVDTRKAAWSTFADRCTSGTGEVLAGLIIGARATEIRKKDGSPFTKVAWEAVSDEVLARYMPAAPAPEPATPAPATA